MGDHDVEVGKTFFNIVPKSPIKVKMQNWLHG